MKWAQGWQEAGLEVTWFANAFRGSSGESSLNDIRIVRRGGPYSQSWHACTFDRRDGPFDLVLEEINTLPFLSCLWARERSVLLMHQLAREVWFYEAAWGLSSLGYLIEPLYLRLYRNQPALVLSESTRTDLVRLGFDHGRIGLLAGATDAIIHNTPKRRKASRTFSFIYVGRLTASKRVHDIITAFAMASRELRSRGLHSRLQIVGSGSVSYGRKLRRLLHRLEIAHLVQFHGWVDKWWLDDRLVDSDVLVMASVREGWGLVVTEANAIGIPAIGYPVHGLRDSIHDGVTGLLAKAQNPRSLSTEMIKLASNPDLLDRLSRASLKDSTTRNWETSKRVAVKILGRAASHLVGPGQNGQGNSGVAAHPVSTLLQAHLALAKSIQFQ